MSGSDHDVDPGAAALAKTMVDLGWPQLAQHLARMTHTGRGEQVALALSLYDDPDDARERIAEISEARALIALDAPMPFGGIRDVRVPVERADKGGVLDQPELLAVADTGRGLTRLREQLAQHADDAPRLNALAADIDDLRHVYEPIADSFDADGTLADHASEALGPLRRKVGQLKQQLERRMKTMVDDVSQFLQDRYFTMREDRYVVPVRVDARSQVRGIIHGTSGSGQTIFVEPDEIVQLGNRLKLAECEVADEEYRIMAALSRHVADAAPSFLSGLDAATVLDVIAAGARLADELIAAPPAIDPGRLALMHARHPLMVLSGKACVANDIVMEPDSILILSGPNAGGKTVALKTAGLLSLMVRAGLHIPAEPGSVAPWFSAIHTDIGDSQSIEKDLSTFTGHIVKLKRYLAEADRDTLLLIDEIAVGTEPEQGAALAQAVLEALAERHARAIVTTHYERLKALGARDDRFANASVGFDLKTMEPTFRLHLGVPGSSGALAVARRLGVMDSVVDRARDLMGERRASIEELLAEVAEERRKLTAERAGLAETRAAADRALADAEASRAAARERERRLKQGAHTEAIAALRGAREELDRLRTTVKKRARSDREVTAAKRKISELASAIAEHAPRREHPEGAPARTGDLKPGVEVYVTSLGSRGVVAEAPHRGKVAVQVGTMRTAVAIDELLIERKRASAPKRPAGSRKRQSGKHARSRSNRQTVASGESSEAPADKIAVRTMDSTIDVRGERADEAVDSVDRFIDKSLLATREVVFVIHGHGTGALRSAIRGHLEGHHAVSSWRAGERAEGGDGVTIAWLDLR